ncbi:FAD-dependent monooxygenase [Hoyosella altamirensis]|uniref:2-polyprenyl-6-methoxyphenol hydroxylase-like FAD-dependent oxidoreductase n=1 Tax=Hoyosella altamirensis TaxID=616997 RepID=A0A839RJA6_9ACTN|nr:FAD-dependent monooxygenase [Hoyosella altamirensis]MBB3036755.1 2-polyprenyl-6-methoxyphenol hydroxylase-like FAD-dependent oxidoreductase [Hoyosella altamirensis]
MSAAGTARRAIVVGGGIGGLASAVALTRKGWNVTVLKRAPQFREIGAGVTLFPNAIRALDYLGFEPQLFVGQGMRAGGLRSKTGRWLMRQEVSQSDVAPVHRAYLHDILRSAVPAESLIADSRVTAVTLTGAVEYCKDGETRTVYGDLIVAADGISSGIRAQHWPELPPAQYVGVTAWRAIAEVTNPHDFGLTQTWAPGAELGIVPLIDGRIYWYAALLAPPGERIADNHAYLLERFGAWHGPIPELIAATEPGALLHHDLFHVSRQPETFVRGKIVLLGDAAHAIPPFLGQGACQALEDAATLGAYIGTRDGLDRYDRVRRERAHAVAKATTMTGRMGIFVRNPALAAARNAIVRATPGNIARRAMDRVTRWEVPAM